MPLLLPSLSRRQFLQHSVGGAAALLLAGQARAAASRPVDPHAWALLSDTHIAGDKARVARDINLADHLTRVVNDVLAWDRRPVAALVDGDLALNTGEAADYATLGELVRPLRAAGIPLHLALGNHDHRDRFWTGLGVDRSAPAPVASKHVSVIPSPRANWFLLDSLDQTNVTPGVLGAAQLAWLGRELDARASQPALVMVHHNPNVGESKGGLTETAALLDLLRARRHVQALFFGHSHRWSVERDPSGLHLVNLPATAYPFDKQQPSGWVRAQLEPKSLRLELRALNPAHPAHGAVHTLAWRA